MDGKNLKDLVCPTKLGKHPCQGRLKLKETITLSQNPATEIKEAILRCLHCQAEYPVLVGIPILMDETRKFLRENYYLLTGLCRTNGGMSPEMHSYIMNQIVFGLKSADEELFPKQKGYNRTTASDFFRGMSAYLINHYDNLIDLVKKGDPLYDFLCHYAHENPHSTLQRMTSKHSNGRGAIAVEIGCSVGGFTAKLARSFKFTYGVDTSLEALVLARRIVKHLPKPFKKYRVYRERNKYSWRSINTPQCQNVEFICASGAHLPFRDRSIDAVYSSNVIDIVKKPMRLLQEKIRILRENGLFLMSDPYDFHPSRLKEFPGTVKKSAMETVRKAIGKKVRIIEEEDNVPWISRNYGRNYQIYFNHCLIGIKKKDE